jgi:hydroxyethylthiazole kinase-like uncharacterized protein yjeF
MQQFNPQELKKIYTPPTGSHKGQNGRLMIIGGSHLFHAASLWALTIASKIVDMVFYSSVVENNQIMHELKREFRNGIIVPRNEIENYITEADCVLIGPGMTRSESTTFQDRSLRSLAEIDSLDDEGEQSYFLTKYLLEKFPKKKWVIDAGALQMMDPEWLKSLNGNALLTPHPVEFDRVKVKVRDESLKKEIEEGTIEQQVQAFAKAYDCTILLKGEHDIVCSSEKAVSISGGNAGMTKGGTGDVLAGLIGALACNNELFLAATAGAYINKKAGEALFEKVGYYFNASDLAEEIPVVMKQYLLQA